jgi:hypothetical protein
MNIFGAKALPPDGDDSASAETRRSRRRRRWVWKEAVLIGAIAMGILLVEWLSMVAEEVWANRKGPGWAIPTTAAGVIAESGAGPSRCAMEPRPVVSASTETATHEANTSEHVSEKKGSSTGGEVVQTAPRVQPPKTGAVQRRLDEADPGEALKSTWREK